MRTLARAEVAKSFQNSHAIETGLSDFYKIIATATKIKFEKLESRVVHDREQIFSNDAFREYLLSKLSLENLSMVLNIFWE